ncbi:MAG: YgjV family protein [Clostridia bacterium]|jgi:hypothetical protein|nr:YgjV family protein [Clostridia bacterium]
MIAHVFGFGAIGCSLLIYTRKKRDGILLFKLVQDLFWATHYGLLGAYSAMASSLICATRETVYYNKNPKISKSVPLFCCFLLFFALSAALTWKSIFSIFPALSSIFSTIAFRIKRPRLLKLMALPSYACTLIYNITVAHSISVYVGLTITLSSITYSFIRDAIASKKEKGEPKDV